MLMVLTGLLSSCFLLVDGVVNSMSDVGAYRTFFVVATYTPQKFKKCPPETLSEL